MDTRIKRGAAFALALALSLSLAACGDGTTTTKSGLSKDEAALYVEGLMKETYLAEFDPAYLDLVDIGEDDAQATYDRGLEVESEYFIYIYDIEHPTDEFREDLKALYADIYKHAKFEVVSAAEQEDGSFSVKVSVEPIDIVQLVDAAWDEAMEPFYKKYPAEAQDAMSDAEYEAMDQEWAQMVLDLYREKLPETGNLEAESMAVQLEKGEDGYYSITDDDFSKLNDLIIAY